MIYPARVEQFLAAYKDKIEDFSYLTVEGKYQLEGDNTSTHVAETNKNTLHTL